MPDKTLREDFNDLRVTVGAFCASQTTWNEAHDRHSREVLAGIEKSTEKLFSIQTKMIEKVGELPIEAHAVRMDGMEKVSKAKFASVNIRIKWLWGILGGGAVTIALGLFFKSILTYLKNPVL